LSSEGPLLESLTHRLAACPADFLAEPRIGAAGVVEVAAVVADLVRDLGGPMPTKAQLAVFQPKDARQHRNWLGLVLIAAWLLYDPWFRQQRNYGRAAVDFLTSGLHHVAGLAQAPRFVTDPDRREELARLALHHLSLLPAGESEAQAADRLSTLDTVERDRVQRAARQAEERAQAIREAMAKKAAEEAAAQYSRE
jgi:hypothetical protein